MYWTELRRALLYGQPQITHDMLQPQMVKTAIREITRQINFGWIDEVTDDMLNRIQTACNQSQCPELWDEFEGENHPFLVKRTRKKGTKGARKVGKKTEKVVAAH